MDEQKVSVIGAGAWGTAFSIILARQGKSVNLWVRERELALRMLEKRVNDIFLPEFSLPSQIVPTADLDATIENSFIIFWAVPTQHLREIASMAKPPRKAKHAVLSKGIERNSWKFPFDILAEIFSADDVAVISGPSFAVEAAAGKPTVLTVAAYNIDFAKEVQDFIADSRLRVYRNSDPLGVSIGGAYKNIIAIAVGISDGIGLGYNARAALITRGLSEMVRLAEAMGARRETLFGVSGVGDLVLTCTSNLSRNYQLGYRIGRGETFEIVQRTSIHIAEGAFSTHGAIELAKRNSIELPIASEVHKILWDNKSPQDGMKSLMERPLKAEW